ncbi:MAG: hypothetical protein GY711_10170 [bacterium]|nr:hypothetical protein [bacterium]
MSDRPSRARKLRRVALGLLLVAAVAGLLTEGFFRYTLFRTDGLSNRIVKTLPTLRRPQSYAHPRSIEHAKLQYLVFGRGRGHEANFDPLLGWVKGNVTPETYEHVDAKRLAGRRPILLLGDSFADCVGEDEDCWQGLLEKSELGERYALLNYGTGSYGFGQISLSCAAALEVYGHLDPLVVVSVLVDDDFDRSLLEFRTWPKLTYGLDDDGALVLGERELPRTRDEYFANTSVGITSYAWRYVSFGTKFRPKAKTEANAEHLRRVFALNGAILRQLVADLEASGLDYFFFLFHGKTFLRDVSPYAQRDEFAIRELERLGVSYALSRTALIEDARETGRTTYDYFVKRGRGANHYTSLGNEVVFRALSAGIEGEF